MRNATLEKVKAAIRHPFAWPGGYPVYTILSDGALLCPTCARTEYRQIAEATLDPSYQTRWEAIGAEVYWEGPTEYCAHCDAPLESAYGDPEDG